MFPFWEIFQIIAGNLKMVDSKQFPIWNSVWPWSWLKIATLLSPVYPFAYLLTYLL